MNTLLTLKKFPKSICTQTTPLNLDREHLIEASIVKYDDNSINFLPYIDPLEIYLEQHNSSVGKTWDLHNSLFSEKIFQYETQRIVEIAGGSGNIYKKFKRLNDNIKWTLIDLNPTIVDNTVNIIKSLYCPELIHENDVVVTSHFLEHVCYVEDFLKTLRSRNPKYHIFSIPNFKKFAESNFCSTLMFEHPHFLTDERVNFLLSKTGWEIVEKSYYNNHSVFYVTRPTQNININDVILTDESELIIRWINYIKEKTEYIKKYDKIYIFGAHFPYYYFLNFGVNEEQIVSVVDNDILKCNKRMYGTNTKVIHSSELPKNSKIVVEMGPYTEEIKHNLKNIEIL